MLDLQPTLIGETLRLRPLRETDREALYEVARDPLIWEQHPQPDRHERHRFDVFFDEAIASRGALAVEDRTGRIVGTTRFCRNVQTDRLEIGWTFLERALWGGSANREMKLMMLNHAFTSVDRVVFLVGHQNLRSQRALAKLGARRVADDQTQAGDSRAAFEITPADLR